MRLSVASTGGATGSGASGYAARFSAVYSLTGSTTQPSGGGPVDVVWAELETAQPMMNSVVESRKRDAVVRSRFMGKSPFEFRVLEQRAHVRTLRQGRRTKSARTFIRDEI